MSAAQNSFEIKRETVTTWSEMLMFKNTTSDKYVGRKTMVKFPMK